MLGSERAESPPRLLELPLAAHAVAPPGLVPRDRDVDKALEEVLLRRIGGAPDVLERLVRLEVLAVRDLREPGAKSRGQLGRRDSQPPSSYSIPRVLRASRRSPVPSGRMMRTE